MKKLMSLLISVPLLVHAQGQGGIRFEHSVSWEQVKAKAKAEGKYIFMDVYTTWCAPCKMMDKEVYPNDTVGSYMNERFISIKVQMDSTGKDNEQVKRWYDDARSIEQKYKIEGYPSFLFFSPDGILTYKDLGYKDVSAFIKLATRAMDPQNILYYSLLEDYKKGKKNYAGLYELVMFAKNTIGNDTLAKQMAEDYISHVAKKELFSKEKIYLVRDVARNSKLADSLFKEYNVNYLNKLKDEEFYTSENLSFIDQFNHLITSKDKIFQLSYSKPEKIDSAINFKGTAKYYVQAVIMQEEIVSRLYKNNQPIFKKPDWHSISAIIRKKYPKVDVKDLVLNYQVAYYWQVNDCPQWAIYKNEKIKSYGPEPAGMEILVELNDLGAWQAFLRCTDEKVLEKALEWIGLAIRLSELTPNISFLDTRANLLYKLGRVNEAIAQEEKAVETGLARSKQEDVNFQSLMSAVNRYREVLKKMRTGTPTYVEEGAVWDSKTLQKIRPGRKISPIH